MVKLLSNSFNILTEIRRGKSADSGEVEREFSDYGAGSDGSQPQKPEQGHRGPA